jgi:hypothetical protein
MTRSLILTAALAMFLPGLITAQRRYDDPPPRGDRGGGRDIARVIADCEARTNDFRRSFRHASEGGFRDHMRMEDLNRHADRLERTMNIVREAWNRERNVGRTRRYVNDALASGQEINRSLARGRIHPEIQRQWSTIRIELNRLAEAFELPRIRWE